MDRPKAPWVAAAALGAVVFALYWPLLRRPYFATPELYYLLSNPSAWDWRNIPALFSADYERRFSGGFYHPLAIAVYMACRSLFGADPVWFRLFQLTLVWAAAALLYMLERGRLHRWALAAALLYACHPLHCELNMLGVRDQLLVVIFLAGIWTRRRPRGWSTTLLTAGLFAMALLSKETGILFPLIMFGDDAAGGRGKPPSRDLVAAGLVLAAYYGLRPHVHAGLSSGGFWGYADHETLAGMVRRLAIFWSRLLGGTAFALPVGWLAAPAAALLFSVRGSPGLAWSYGLWLLPLLLGAGIIPFQPLSELLSRSGSEAHRLLIPAVGYCLLLAAGLRDGFRASGWSRWKGLAPAALAALLLLGTGLGVRRSLDHLRLEGNGVPWFSVPPAVALTPVPAWRRHFADRSAGLEAYFTGALQDSCRSIGVLHAIALQDEDGLWRRVTAGRDLQEGCRLQREGRATKALGLFERSLRSDPTLAWAYRERAILLWLKGERTSARASYALYRRAVERWPYFDRARCLCGPAGTESALRDSLASSERAYNDGIMLFRSGDPTGAVSRLETAARLDPGRPKVQLSLGVALDALGRFRPALEAYDTAIEAESRIEALFGIQPRDVRSPSDPARSQWLLWAALSSRAETRYKLGLRRQALDDLKRIESQSLDGQWRQGARRRIAQLE